ncbi:integrase [Pasteurella multocida subsp. multocida str. P52VAC]|nr:integrase [Pasteurella multocida subsp. multocida str. P52VAC]
MPKITRPLTNTEVEKAKPQAKEYTLTDGYGLFYLFCLVVLNHGVLIMLALSLKNALKFL